jgi:hypothetical protein
MDPPKASGSERIRACLKIIYSTGGWFGWRCTDRA